MIVRRKYTFYGKVQEVGFRYLTYQLANKFKVTGWVKNNDDGSVTACFQGKDYLIEIIINELKLRRYINITKLERKDLMVKIDENGFKMLN